MPSAIVEDLVECDECGDTVPDTRTIGGDELCEDCADAFTRCEHCDRWTTEDMFLTEDEGSICETCRDRYYDVCSDCERVTDVARTTNSGDTVCTSCVMYGSYWECNDCDVLLSDGNYCDDCVNDHDDEYDSDSDYVHDYGYKPVPQFHGTGPLYLGLELEINADGSLQDSAETAYDRLGELGYLKEDGSISHGFEIVTHPMSYDWAMKAFPWGMLGALKREDCSAEGNGLHVHISRDAFESPAHVYRWMKLLHRNVPQVTAIARRVCDQWAAFTPTDRVRVKDYAKGACGARYRAINTQNSDTFELRIFASSLKPREVKAALGLAAASVEYTRDLTVTDIVTGHGWDWAAFAAWIGEHTEYAPLAEELEVRACAS